jgi:hypothetical protein
MLLEKVPAAVIASQCGTSLQMLDQHCNHVMPEMFTMELSGVDLTAPAKTLTKITTKKYDVELAEMTADFYANYEKEIKNRGCK